MRGISRVLLRSTIVSFVNVDDLPLDLNFYAILFADETVLMVSDKTLKE